MEMGFPLLEIHICFAGQEQKLKEGSADYKTGSSTFAGIFF